ncbi:MAG: twin-arginine translocase subunit TatC [Planctomycetota bacterium]
MKDASTQDDGVRMALGDHLEELRRRLIYALLGLAVTLAAAIPMAKPIIDMLRHPYRRAMAAAEVEAKLSALKLSSGLTAYLEVVFVAALLLACPWVFYQIWKFVAAGLYEKERRAVLFAVPFSTGLFVAGAVFFIFVVAVPVMRFLLLFNKWLGLEMVITFASYIRFVAAMSLVFGLAFQTPLVVLVLGRVGIVSLEKLRHYRRHVVVALLIAAMVLTPPDPISQLCLAVPMWVLYELGVVLVWLLAPRARAKRR